MNLMTTNTILYCSNWKAAVEFYRDAIELPVLFSNDWFFEFQLSHNSRLSIADETRASIEPAKGKGITLAFQTSDIEEALRNLHNRNIKTTAIKKHPWNAKVFYLFDPEGNRIEFWQKIEKG